MGWTRRELLRAAGALGALTALPRVTACAAPLPTYTWDGPLGPEDLFRHGVASGDPLSDAVILWTRLSTTLRGELEAFVEVAEDVDFARRVAARPLATSMARDATVKVDVDGLQPGTTYYYRFWSEGRVSPVGRTRTAPEGPTEALRLATVSCSNHANGYFHVYRALAERADLDLVVHLGDYLYEYATGRIRAPEPPNELVELGDYRRRHAQYRTDPDLADCHRQHPFVCTWDDHETANNAWKGGADNHTPGVEGSWSDRVDAGRQAYLEWLPVREGPEAVLYRHLVFGDLVDLVVLDTRVHGRDQQTDDVEVVYDDARQLLGQDQEAWALDRVRTSGARWVLIAQQVVMARWGLGPIAARPGPLNPDAWDGYPAARARLLQAVADAAAHAVVLTGDVHSSWANDLALDPDAYDPDTRQGSVAVEVVTPAVTSSGIDLGGLERGLVAINPHIRFVDTLLRGFVLLDVTASRVQAEWWLLPNGSVDQPDYVAPARSASLVCRWGEPWWVEGDAALALDGPPLAP